MNLILYSVSNNLAYFRIYAGLTQQELADIIGCSKNTISSYELGHCYPTVKVLYAIAYALNCKPTELYDFLFDSI